MRPKLRSLAVGLALGFVAVSLVGMMVSRNMAIEGTYTYLRLFNEVLSLIRSSYVDEVNTDSLMKGAYEGMLSELDPFSEYFTAEEYAEYSKQMAAAKVSTGARAADTGLRVARKDGVILVVAVKPGSDAEAKGITPGDHVRRIADQSTREMPLYKADSLLSGVSGTSVAISVARREEPRKIESDLLRREVPPQPPTLDITDAKDGLAVLRIPQFGPGTANEVAALLDRAESSHVKRLLVDLRGNAWGGVDEAARGAGLFLGDTVVARLKSKEGAGDEVRAGRSKSTYSGMVPVLLNGSTADAAELFAAALHDGRGARLLGEASFGVGAQQECIPLKNGSWLKLSVRKYVSAAGTSWHGSGLKPEKVISVSQENLKPAERLKQQLKAALETLRTLDAAPPAAKTTSAAARAGSGRPGPS